jgi:hypothetical protein
MASLITRTSGGIRVVITPPRWSIHLRVFLVFWTAAWITLAWRQPVRDWNWRFGIAAFAAGTIFFGLLWIWNTKGREELDFASDSLTHRRLLFRLSRVDHFKMSMITNPRFVASRQRARGGTPSGLGFSYGIKIVRIGDEISWSESKAIAFAVAEAFPEHATVWRTYEEGVPDSRREVDLNLR